MKPLKNIKLIILDLDGVVVDTMPDLAVAVQKTGEAMGCGHISAKEAGSHVGRGAKKGLGGLLGPERAHLLDKAQDYFRTYYSEHCADRSLLYTGVRDVLEHFRGRMKIAMATAKIRPATENILEKLGVLQYFDMIVTADDMQRMKPDPQCIEIILDSLGVKADEAVMVGDMKTDIQAGKAAGTATIAVTYGYGKPKDLESSDPDILIDNFFELKDVVCL
jgi:phosphoglycolate phosphatase